MSEADLAKLIDRFEYVKAEFNTPEKATELLRKEGLLDENGQTAEHFRGPMELVCH